MLTTVAQASPSRVKIVAVDDDAQFLDLLSRVLASDELDLQTTTDPEEAIHLVKLHSPPIVLVDLMMPIIGGMEMLDKLAAIDPSIDVLLLTSDSSPEAAVEAIRRGACDFLTKPVNIPKLRARIQELAADARKRQSVTRLDSELLDASQFLGMIGRSPAMLEVFSRIRRVAPYFRSVLITGPTGSGKELVARALHKFSPAGSGKFVSFNCGAFVEPLMESELFGHVKGAFTGASHDKIGLFEYAHQGVLFLDEIGEMPAATQSRLLRVLQEQEVQRVGSPVAHKVDVRVVAATNRSLVEMIRDKKFRGDLYYRISIAQIALPSLFERREDLPMLVSHFLRKFAEQYGKPTSSVTRRVQLLFARYTWPGNVRELENVIAHACMMAEGSAIQVHDLPEYMRAARAEGRQTAGQRFQTLEEAQRTYAMEVLQATGYNRQLTAEILGISRTTLYRMLPKSPSAAKVAQGNP